MSKIKKINPSDAVLCWVGTTREMLNKKEHTAFIVFFNKVHRYVGINGDSWFYAEPVEQEKEETSKWSDKYPKDWSIDAKIFKAISEGAVVHNININQPVNQWFASQYNIYEYFKICTNYTGKDTDKWEEII